MSIKQQVHNLIKGSNSRFCSVTFTKKNEDERTILIQPSKSFVRRPKFPNLITVYGVHEKDFRTINLDTVSRVRSNGATLTVG